MPSPRSAVVLVFDRLQAALLGPYGSTWCDTPACNRLAAEGYLAEQFWSDSSQLETIYRSYWSGQHAAVHRDSRRDSRSPAHGQGAIEPSSQALAHDHVRSSLAQRLSEAGLYTELITDDLTVANHPWADPFHDRLVFAQEGMLDAAETAGNMRVAQLMAAAAERLHEITNPSLLWIHAGAWNDAWDAPYDFRRQWADEEDPEPPRLVLPPSKVASQRFDPDELLGYLQAYVGQVAAWDACLEAWHEAFLASPLADDALLIVTSPRAFPLGEHGVVGDAAVRLYSELLRVPFFLRHPHAAHPLVRDQALLQPADLYPTLLQWCLGDPACAAPSDDSPLYGKSFLDRAQGNTDMAPPSTRSHAAAVAPHQIAVISKSWLLRAEETSEDTDPSPHRFLELYAKPDDRWEANEVSSRCPEAVEEMQAIARDPFGWRGEAL